MGLHVIGFVNVNLKTLKKLLYLFESRIEICTERTVSQFAPFFNRPSDTGEHNFQPDICPYEFVFSNRRINFRNRGMYLYLLREYIYGAEYIF